MKLLRENSRGAERDLYDKYRRWGEVGEWNYSPLFCGSGQSPEQGNKDREYQAAQG